MALLSVDEALRRVLASVERPVGAEEVRLERCAGRTLAGDLPALRTQPPFPASSMDGYAVRAADAPAPGARLKVAGVSAAGHGYGGALGPGETVRIFTGAPVPEGADGVILQEDATAAGDHVTFTAPVTPGRFIRPAGLDFEASAILLHAGERLDARRIALAAAMGHPRLPVRRKPRVALIATGDELVRPGEPAGPDQIVASNLYALAAITERAGAEALDLGIVQDNSISLENGIDGARRAGADLLVTLGGASVGEHDLVQSALTRQGMDLGFWRIALRPGKPLMHGRLGTMLVLGLPGNPVSSIVCAIVFLVPAIRAMLGDPGAPDDTSEAALLGGSLPANDARQDFLRAKLEGGDDGLFVATAHPVQDSSMLSVLAASQGLIVRAPHAPQAEAGEPCRIVRLDRFC